MSTHTTSGRKLPDESRLARLKAQARQPGEAKFFFYDATQETEAVRVLPGEYFVCNEELLILTTLGSCIAVCLWDQTHQIGGLNHFMLPDAGSGLKGGCYGEYAMESLLNTMAKHGASRGSLEAKVFGGARVMNRVDSMSVGQRNTEFAFDYLEAKRIPVASQDVLDICPRRICFSPTTGKVMVKRLATSNTEATVAQERAATQQIASVMSRTIKPS